MRCLGVTALKLTQLGFPDDGEGKSWVELAVRMDEHTTAGEKDVFLEECQAFHTKVSLRMRTHLSLMAKNIDRTTWLAARLHRLDWLHRHVFPLVGA